MSNAVGNAVGNAVTERVTNTVGNATRNAAPDPTRPDPTQKTLMVTTPARPLGRNARGQASSWQPSELPPPWFRPYGAPARTRLAAARQCDKCRTIWHGNDPCFACGQDGRLRFPQAGHP